MEVFSVPINGEISLPAGNLLDHVLFWTKNFIRYFLISLEQKPIYKLETLIPFAFHLFSLFRATGFPLSPPPAPVKKRPISHFQAVNYFSVHIGPLCEINYL